MRRHPRLVRAVALAIVAGGAAVPPDLTGGDSSCTRLPAATRALADDPAVATRALDPQDDMSRFPAVRAQARAVYAVAAVYDEAEVPPGAEPGPDARRIHRRHHADGPRQRRRQHPRGLRPVGRGTGRQGPVPLRRLPLTR
ncbi:hypothetical protein ACFY8K_13530 [Streptomyces misionensis]|uniref:hypothetical protein n=1 Tax=Streptomyces misionensis TaxID=67331 RepID=UPI0036BEAFD7